jgi:hypothetical protein
VHPVDANPERPGPTLSVVLTGRNDGHGNDFCARFFRTLRFNAQQLAARNISHEFVFVEWAPPVDRPRLRDLIREEAPEVDARTLRWISVDPRYQAVLTQNPRLRYLEFIAKNVGIRRASGDFVLTTNCDVLLSRHVLDMLHSSRLQPRTLYRARRFDLKQDLGTADLQWPVLEDPVNLELKAKPLRPPLFSGGTGDFLLLDRGSCHRVRGFNEVYRVAKIAVDRNFLVKVLSSGLAIVDIGGPVYHINHEGSYRASRSLYEGREKESPWGSKRWHSQGVVYNNPDTWGLRDAPSRQENEQSTVLDFSWDAVPPLVDLRRIVVPVSRRGGPMPGRYVAQSSVDRIK